MEVLERLEGFKPTRGVYGNVDGAELRAALPAQLEWECEGLRVYMTHIGGYPGNYDPRARGALTRIRPGLFICGHSHVLKVIRDPALELIHMNPGAAGHTGWHTVRTAIRFTILGGKIFDAEAIELGPRGRKGSSTPQRRL
jgi:predicted phosphodiesterase